jgi:hypothetical protein
VCVYIDKCRVARVTKITGPNSDGWIYWHFGYTVSLNYNYYRTIADLNNAQLILYSSALICTQSSQFTKGTLNSGPFTLYC